MQIVYLSSDNAARFRPIEFNWGDNSNILNVVFGDIHHPDSTNLDSHNLGKTTLIQVIDFMFLAKISKDHIFKKRTELFSDLTFYMELRLSEGTHIAIKRSVANPTKINLAKSHIRFENTQNLDRTQWDHSDVPLDRAQEILDSWLNFNCLGPFSYRKSLTYFLRSQNDWLDELQLQKFSLGKDRTWKPFVGQLFGFDQEKLQRKYSLDSEVEELKKEKEILESRTDEKTTDLSRLKAELSIMESSLNTREQELDSFQFNEAEENLIKDLVHSTETNIAELNLKIYNLNYDLSQINEALVQRDKLNLEDVDRVFSEAEIHFPDQLKRDYLALLAFRKKITAERRRELRKRSKEIEIELEIAAAQKAQLDTLRHSNVDAITSDDTIQKFKALQKNLREERIRYERRREDYERLKDLAEASRAHREKQRERDSLADEVGAMIEASTPQLEKFQRYFDQYCQTVLGLEGIFTLTANKYGNLEYEIGLGLDDKKGVTSSQGMARATAR